ncbi:MAG: hypothetical protein K8L91_18445 [Anaerolineae bacterium]|nr:hypothetical protein [Anaerolineae bacterium]
MMVELVIQKELAERLQAIAQRENRPLEAVLQSLLELYESLPNQPNELIDPFDTFVDSLDTDLTDLSTTVRETMTEYYRKKFGNPD